MDYPKRLIEVDLPIKRISAHARREKSIRHGHISTLHIWWARRPLAACRAVICASLWPDPADENCPQTFRDAAARLITAFAEKVYNTNALHATASKESFGQWEGIVAARAKGIDLDPNDPAHLNKLRFALLDFIADFANWDNSTVREYLDTSRAMTQAAHEALGGTPGTRPLVVDPFAGGGSIPLEALRVGADAFASDLNPVAVLLNKVVLELIPKYGKRLADEVRKWGIWVRKQAEKELNEFYPTDPDGATPIAYLWARTIRCEGPSCGIELPLIRSLWLGQKPHNLWSMRIRPNRREGRLDIDVTRPESAKETSTPMVRRGSATCPICGYTTPIASVRQQLKQKKGGARGARLLCVATLPSTSNGRTYRGVSESDREALSKALAVLKSRPAMVFGGEMMPREPTPAGGGSGAGRAFSQRTYGMNSFADLFTARQILTLSTLSNLTIKAGELCAKEGDLQMADAVQQMLGLNVSKLSDYHSSLVTWMSQPSKETVGHTFARPALSMVWDFAEANPLAGSSGGWQHSLDFLVKLVDTESGAQCQPGRTAASDATKHPLPDDSVDAFITDPPYYDAVPYADLSEFFIVWLKRSLHKTSVHDTFLSKDISRLECVLDEVKGHDADFFHRTMHSALSEGRRICKPSGIAIIVFAHKATAAWELLLQSIIDAGWVITGSWPIDTERGSRLRAMDSAALASSVHLVCRPREYPDGSLRDNDTGEWRDVLEELPFRIHEWLPRLAHEGIVGADAIFACLGPALEIFSRYSRVERADGTPVSLREYLEQVWAAVAKGALSLLFKDVDAAGLEPDARLTAMWLWTLRTEADDKEDKEVQEVENEDEEDEKSGKSPTKGGFVLEFDAARKIAQGLGANLEELRSVVEVKGQTARLLPVSERAVYLLGKPSLGIGSAPVKGSRKAKTGFLPGMEDVKKGKSRASDEGGDGDEIGAFSTGTTTLDRIHQVMLLFARGRSDALKRFLVDDGIGKDARFWKLAQSLSALYPPGTDEKRWVDGVLARKKGLGL